MPERSSQPAPHEALAAWPMATPNASAVSNRSAGSRASACMTTSDKRAGTAGSDVGERDGVLIDVAQDDGQ